MKKLILLSALAALSILTGCRAKKETIVKSDSTFVATSATQSHVQETHIDTGKINSSKVTEQKQVVITNDSTHTKTTITPVPGTQSTVDPDGTFHGQAQNVQTEHKKGTTKTDVLDSKVQETAAELKGISDTKTVDSSSVKKDSTAVRKLNKHVDIKPAFGAWPWVWGLVALEALMILLWWFLRRPKK